jgi:hypothetical protein
MESVDTEYYNSLQWIRENDPTELELAFQVIYIYNICKKKQGCVVQMTNNLNGTATRYTYSLCKKMQKLLGRAGGRHIAFFSVLWIRRYFFRIREAN